MTNREFYEQIIDLEINEDLKEHANKQLEKMDKANANRSQKPSKKSLENEPIKEELLNILANADDLMITKEITEEYNLNAITTLSVQKVSALLTQLVKDKKVVKGEPRKRAMTYQINLSDDIEIQEENKEEEKGEESIGEISQSSGE